MNYLFVGAHPDDIEISAMGFLTKLLQNKDNKIFMTTATVSNSLSKEKEIRIKEQSRVSLKLKTDFENYNFIYDLDFEDGLLINHILSLKNEIEKIIEKYNIQIIVTHFGKDTHLDHETLSKACDVAGRKISIINFESPNVFDFIPNFYVPLSTKDLELKNTLMKLHTSQNIKNNNFYLDKIKATAVFRGQAVYEKYAEAFYIKRLKFPIIF